jgi:coniferyl-aldehyde dehydrogenase
MANNLYSAEYEQQQIILLEQILNQQKQAFVKHKYPTLDERKTQLLALKRAIIHYQAELISALSEDFGHRASDDSKLGDILPTIMGINYTLKHLRRWMKPSKRQVGMLFQPATAYVMYQPLGVIGIVTPWNYPVFLALGPLTAAIAAGNRVLIKLSEFTPATNKVLRNLLSSVFEPAQVSVFDGATRVASHFCQQAFDHLLFTGSSQVGKLVMANAAKNLTPVTLELGGKSPTIIADDIDITDAVTRFILAKTLNAGQTCVAPDYILCPEHKMASLIQACQTMFNQMYPNLSQNPDYSSIINHAQYQRLQHYLKDAQAKGAQIHPLATHTNEQQLEGDRTRTMPLTLLTQVTDDMQIMQHEIFGPLLPIVGYQHLEQAINYVNQRPRPLALYLCSHDHAVQQRILHQTHAGSVCINDAAIQVAQDDLPFGGIGASGMGQYHGHEGFLTFSKAKSVLRKGRLNGSTLAFPPYGKWLHQLIYRLFLR